MEEETPTPEVTEEPTETSHGGGHTDRRLPTPTGTPEGTETPTAEVTETPTPEVTETPTPEAETPTPTP